MTDRAKRYAKRTRGKLAGRRVLRAWLPSEIGAHPYSEEGSGLVAMTDRAKRYAKRTRGKLAGRRALRASR